MKILSLLFALAISLPAFAKRSSPDLIELEPPAEKVDECLPELVPPASKGYKVHHGDLIITFDNEIFWKGQRVILSHVEGPTVRMNTAPLNLVLAMVRKPYEVLSAEELFNATWAKRSSNDYKTLVSDEMRYIRHCFKNVDPEFDAIKTWWGRGYSWDDGAEKILKTFDDIPELVLTTTGYIWNGQLVKLSLQGKIFVEHLLIYRSFKVPKTELIELLKSAQANKTYRNPKETVKDEMNRIRKAFMAVDPTFDRIGYEKKALVVSYTWQIRR